MSDLTMAAAQAAIAATMARASEMDVHVNVAVVDGDCNLKAFARMDHALTGAADVAVKKARTAGMFNLRTDEIGELTGPEGPFHGIETANDGLVTFGGGVPIRDLLGALVGAIGVSGGAVEDDILLAETGADAVLRMAPMQGAHAAVARAAGPRSAARRPGARATGRSPVAT